MAQSERWLPPLDDGPGPAAPIPDARASAMVEAAIERAFPAPAPRRLSLSRAPMFAMAATLAIAAAAAAYAWRHRAPATNAPPAAPESSPAVVVAPPAPATSASAPADSAESTAPYTAAPSVSAAPGPARPARAPSAEATDLLARANELRAARRWAEAAQTYERVLVLHASSSDATVATVAAADLHLDHLHDPKGALRLYRSARGAQGGGALAEQVSWGIARSTRALGDARAEQAALTEYLERYPSGLFAADARQRLADLAGPR
jgi:hypothetical protein